MKSLIIFFRSSSWIIGMIVLFLIIGTGAYQFLENWTWIESFYFSVATMTTVGYGDFVPTTPVSMLFTSVYMIFGVIVFFSLLSFITIRVVEWGIKRGCRNDG